MHVICKLSQKAPIRLPGIGFKKILPLQLMAIDPIDGFGMTAVDQNDWVVRLQSPGDARDQALSELRKILVRGLTATCRNRCSGRVLAEDVVQNALIKILKSLDSFQGRSKFTTWAMTIAIRTAISEMRHKSFQDVSIESLIGSGMQIDPIAPQEPESNDHKSVLLTILKELIEVKLSPKQRDVVQALLNGMPVEVFAEKTSSNRNAVYKLIHDARIKLRQGFEQAGYQAEDIYSAFA